ncbi:hypothetical protein J6590_090968 [Homalodisca vitripennis]|nr:hypothetical protein J6590_090968 [Homalodisca vitripennis]
MNPIRKSGLVARSLLGGDFNPLVVKPLVQGRNNNVTHKEVRGTRKGEGPPPLRIPSCQRLRTRPKKDLADLDLLRIDVEHFELITNYRLASVLNTGEPPEQADRFRDVVLPGRRRLDRKGECQEMKKGLPNASTETTKIGYGQVYDATPCNFHMQHKEGTYDDEINSYSSSDALNFEAGGSQGLQKV